MNGHFGDTYGRGKIHSHFIVKAVHELSMMRFSLSGYHWKLNLVYSWPFCQVVNILPHVS